MFGETAEIIGKVIREAKEGVINIGEESTGFWQYYIKFYTNLEGKLENENPDRSVLEINNAVRFIEKVDRYLGVACQFYKNEQIYIDLSDKPFKEKLVTTLIANASNYDLANMLQYIDKKTEMLLGKSLEREFTLGGYSITKNNNDEETFMIQAAVKKLMSNLEGPYKFETSFARFDGENFKLPAVTFGIVGDEAYVYAVQNGKTKQTGLVAKVLDRHFRKIGKGVDSQDIISQVSPNALVALTLFISYLKSLGVKKIHAKEFLPLRYTSSVDSPRNNKKNKSEEEISQIEDRLERIDANQFNMTNKFMYLFLRYNHHFPECEANYIDELCEMQMDLKESECERDENIIYKLDAVMQKEKEEEIILI